MNKSVLEARAPDFYDYEANPLSCAACEGEFVHLRWPDDATLACHRYWLKENAVGQGGIDLATREGFPGLSGDIAERRCDKCGYVALSKTDLARHKRHHRIG